jgi:Holliday junction DNA helicase RuvA
MFDFIEGKVVSVKPDRVIIQVGGLGFSVKVPVRVSHYINKDKDILLYTSLNLKEDSIELYGFLESLERELFEELIKIAGVGVKMAMNIISTYDRKTLQEIIDKEDIKSLSKVPGIGKKTAQRILLELKGVLPSLVYERDQIYEDILSALVNLGYKKTEAKEVLEKIYSKDKNEGTIIKECLAVLADKHGE